MPLSTPMTLEDLYKRHEIGSPAFNEAVLYIVGLLSKPVAPSPAPEPKPAPVAKKASK